MIFRKRKDKYLVVGCDLMTAKRLQRQFPEMEIVGLQ